MKIVAIKWKDAQSVDDWTDSSAVCGELASITTVGVLVKTTKEAYSVALNYDLTNDKYSCIINIPKTWVASFSIIRSKKI